MNIKGYNAHEAASLLLQGMDLSEGQIEYLATALDEVAEFQTHTDDVGSIACYECASELTQMNSLDRGSIEPVVHALTGLSFALSWTGHYGARTFFIVQNQRRGILDRSEFETLYANCGWGSDAHRSALRHLLVAHV
jgi:hypothetical protein